MNFPLLLAELTQSTDMIRSLTDGILQEDAQAKPAPDSWSVLEVICHLYDEEREDFREHLDFILYRQNEEWHRIDPQGWVQERNYNQQNFEEARQRFFAEREKSLKWLKGLSGANWNTIYSSSFGSISAGDMFASWAAHDNLHIRQLVELRRFRIENITKPHTIEYAGEW